MIAFAKYEGLGNDFVIVDGRDLGALDALDAEAAAVALCDRHRGIGADGILLVRFDAGRPSMKVVNADGSVPEMCGNGLRCVALHLTRTAGAQGVFEVDTPAGPHRCELLSDGRISVAMRPASLAPSEVPVLADAPLIDAPFSLGDAALHVTAVSMGNPHAVIFDDVGEARRSLGPALGRDARFPAGVNVGFARLIGERSIELHVHERGVGWTQACGTGACACAVAAVETGRCQRGVPIEVLLPGGPVEIRVDSLADPITMVGPARHVFDGRVELA